MAGQVETPRLMLRQFEERDASNPNFDKLT